MDWSKVGQTIAQLGAPLLGGLLGGPAGTKVGALVAQALGSVPEPAAVAHAIDTREDAPERLQALEHEQSVELRALTLKLAAHELTEESRRFEAINATIRAEVEGTDAYARRWRPTFGYAVAATWVLQTVGGLALIAYIVAAAPERLGEALGALGSLASSMMVQWSVALSVLGLAVYKRTQDKQIESGQPAPPSSLGQALVQAVTRRGH